MNVFAQDASFREVADLLTPSAVSQYLAAQHWELESRRDRVREIWVLTDESGRPQGRIMLPLSTKYEDFTQRFYDALLAIGKINGWDATQLQEQIIATRADLLFLHLDQEMTDGTIPLTQAESSLAAIGKMLKSAATTAADPQHSHRGRRPSSVTEFIDQDVRLGHTKRGSFVFTVVSRFGNHASMPLDSQDRSSDEKPFSRQVMETLAIGLETTQDLCQGRRLNALDSPTDWGLSAGLVESLEDLARPDTLRSLDLSFEWAASEEKPSVGIESIRLEHAAVEELARVRERLIRREEPPRRETLVGVVRSLAREESDDQGDHGEIVLATEVNRKPRNIHVNLDGEDHDWAILAYREKLPLTIIGDLVFQRRSWWLVGEIVLDTSFLRHHFGDDPRPR